MSDVGAKIKAIRKSRELTQIKLSKISGVAQATISAIENGTKNPSTDTLLLLAKAMNTPLSDILDNEKKAATEDRDGKTSEMLFLMNRLSPEAQAQAMDYLRFLASHADKK